MSVVRTNPQLGNETLREMLFAGDLVVFTDIPAVAELVTHTRQELQTLFAPHDPQQAHAHFTPAELAEKLSAWKPRFMRLETSLHLEKEILRQIGFDPTTTHYDFLKPRTSYPVDHLTTGIAYAFPWHRDTWYGAPRQQINLWFPIWDVRADNAMGFDPAGFGKKVPNDSDKFDYYRRNEERKSLAKVVKKDTRSQPGAIDWKVPHEDIMLLSPGQILLFSGDQLHRSIPNTSGLSRYSVDFRVIDVADIQADRGAPALDVACVGTAARDFKRVSDDGSMPSDCVLLLEPEGPPVGAELTFKPDT